MSESEQISATASQAEEEEAKMQVLVIEASSSLVCLVCDRVIKNSSENFVEDLFQETSVTAHTQQQLSEMLSSIIKSPLDSSQVYSKAICRRCFRLLDELDGIQQRSVIIKTNIEGWYNRSLLRRLNMSQSADMNIDGMELDPPSEEDEPNLKVKREPPDDLDDDDLLGDELRPEDQGIRADDPEFNPAYEYEWSKGRVKGRGSTYNYQRKVPPKRKFRKAWLYEEEFQGWLRKVEGNPEKSYCQTCRSEMSADRTSIKRRKVSKCHTKNSAQTADSHASAQTAYSHASTQTAYSPAYAQTAYSPAYAQTTYSHASAQTTYSHASTQTAYSPAYAQTTYSPANAQRVYSPAYAYRAYSPDYAYTAYSPIGRSEAEDAVTRAEIKLAMFMAEHHIPLKTSDHLVDLIKNIFPDSRIARKVSLKGSNTTHVLEEIGKISHKKIIEDLRKTKFSLIVGETTGISTSKTCVVVVKYFDKSIESMQTRLLVLLNIYGPDNIEGEGSAGQQLFNLLFNFLSDHEIPVENLIGFAADGAHDIMGDHNSAVSRLRSEVPGISILKCISHSIHLCSSQAAKTLPRDCEDLVRAIFAYFAHSITGKNELVEFQVFCNVKPHKLLHSSQTQWLSLHTAVSLVLEQWWPLTLYFSQKHLEDGLSTSKFIHDTLNDISIYLSYLFLNFILPKFNSFNCLFQKREPTIHLLYASCKTLYVDILRCYYKHDLLDNALDITTIDPTKEENFLCLDQVYLGADLHEQFQTPDIHLNSNLIAEVRTQCRQFMITTCVQIKERFPFDSKLVKLCSALSVSDCVSGTALTETPSMWDLAAKVPRIYTGDFQKLDDEWRLIWLVCVPYDLKSTVNPEVFFNGLGELTDCEGNKRFSVLPEFVNGILTLPTSNADAERIFSKVKLNATENGNKLLTCSQSALVFVSEIVESTGGCVEFKPSKTMLKAVQRSRDTPDEEEDDIV